MPTSSRQTLVDQAAVNARHPECRQTLRADGIVAHTQIAGSVPPRGLHQPRCRDDRPAAADCIRDTRRQHRPGDQRINRADHECLRNRPDSHHHLQQLRRRNRAYLADHQLTDRIRAIVARDDHDPQRIKPDPCRVRAAVAILNADNSECSLVGGSTSDVFAGLLRRSARYRLRKQSGQSAGPCRRPGHCGHGISRGDHSGSHPLKTSQTVNPS
jgi:hypothetical protein